ncbi:hypothetical protein PCLA_04r0079 [Pseudomonas citronellolis]|nr:hypothetical protein PCLA_04r0079 [Pseudomonas citronellolis]
MANTALPSCTHGYCRIPFVSLPLRQPAVAGLERNGPSLLLAHGSHSTRRGYRAWAEENLKIVRQDAAGRRLRRCQPLRQGLRSADGRQWCTSSVVGVSALQGNSVRECEAQRCGFRVTPSDQTSPQPSPACGRGLG